MAYSNGDPRKAVVYISRKKKIRNDEKESIEADPQILRSPVGSSLADLFFLVRAGQDATSGFNVTRPGFRRQECPK
jgi:hypothetical protein